MAAALPFPAIEAKLFSLEQDSPHDPCSLQQSDLLSLNRDDPRSPGSRHESKEILEVKVLLDGISGVFRGRELTRKERRLTCGITPIDDLIGGGIVRGRISEIVGSASAGKTSLATSFAAAATRRGEVVAWIDASGSFDPSSTATAGVDLARMLWVAMPVKRAGAGYRTGYAVERYCSGSWSAADELDGDRSGPARMTESVERKDYGQSPAGYRSNYARKRSASTIVLKAAEWILTAGGFGLVVIDYGGAFDACGAFTQSAALRLARGAERSGAAVIVIGPSRMCGTFAALSLMLSRSHACFNRVAQRAPVLFDGLTVAARVMRNKLGGAGGVASWQALAEPSSAAISASPPIATIKSTFAAAVTRRAADSSNSLSSTEPSHKAGGRAAAR